jgi:hypothetical protein
MEKLASLTWGWEIKRATQEAVRNGNVSVVQLLIRFDPKLACFENHAGEPPLFLPAREGKRDV